MKRKETKLKEMKKTTFLTKTKKNISKLNSKTLNKKKGNNISKIIDLNTSELDSIIEDKKNKEIPNQNNKKKKGEDMIYITLNETISNEDEIQEKKNIIRHSYNNKNKENFLGIMNNKNEKKNNNKNTCEEMNVNSLSKFPKGEFCSKFLTSKKTYEDFNDDKNEKGDIFWGENNCMFSKFNRFLKRKRIKENSEESEDKNSKEKKKKKLNDTSIISEISEKNNQNKNRSKSFTKINKKKKTDINYLTPELGMLYYLIEEYGIENVVDSLYKSDKIPKNKLDSCIKGMKEIYGENKLIIMVIKSIINLIKENFGIFPSKKSCSSSKNKSVEYNKENKDKYFNLDKEGNNQNTPIIILDDEDNNDEVKKIEEKKENNDQINNIKKNGRVISIESHYNKGNDGNIYKYEVGYLLGKIVIFHCFDKECNSIGTFDLETKKFKLQKDHNLKHCEHNYIINYDKENDTIFKEIIEKNYLDAQIFREGKVMIVRYFS